MIFISKFHYFDIAKTPQEAWSHRHDNFELMFLHSGQVSQVQSTGEHRLMFPGDIYFAPAKFDHGSYGYEGAEVIFTVINFDPQIFGLGDAVTAKIHQLLRRLGERASVNYHLASLLQDERSQVDTILEFMLREHQSQSPFVQEQLKCSLAQIFFTLLGQPDFRAFHELDKMEADHQLVDQILFFINSNYHMPDLNVDMVLQHFPLSRSHFFLIFKVRTGKSFTVVVNETRLQYAAQMLLQTRLPITDILYRVGYSNPSHFGHLFNVFFGQSPREYRKQGTGKGSGISKEGL